MRAVRETKYTQKSVPKRGEKEAVSLRRRRRFKSFMRAVSVIGICVSIVSSLYLWRSGLVETWIYSAETKMENSLVDAGLTVESVTVEGYVQSVREEIDAVLDISIGEPLLAIDIKAMKDRVELLDWVKVATITRKFPDAMFVNIHEHKPAALWQIDNKLWVLSDEGVKITDKSLEYFSELPMISGFGADNELENLLMAVTRENDLFDLVETATWIGGRRWDLILNNGIKILLPELEMADAWSELFELNQREKLLAKNILAVDFRVQGKTVIRLTPEEADRRRLLAKTSGNGKDI